MNKITINLAIAACCLLATKVVAQTNESLDSASNQPSMFDKKFRWGVSWNQYWGNIMGDRLSEDYFGKPCIGTNARLEYYPLSFVGVGVGFGIQQRGAGIINPDNSGGSFTHPWEQPQFDGDSTFRQRLRFNTLELPVSVHLRTPKDVIKGVRPSLSAGVSYVKIFRVNDFFLSVEDGYHQDMVVTSDYAARDLAYQLTLGADIDAGGTGIVQMHFVYTSGTSNLYARNQGDGRLITYGFRVSFLY